MHVTEQTIGRVLRGLQDNGYLTRERHHRDRRRHVVSLTAEGRGALEALDQAQAVESDRKSTRLNSSHVAISYAVFCLKKKSHGRRNRDSRRPRTLRGPTSGVAVCRSAPGGRCPPSGTQDRRAPLTPWVRPSDTPTNIA